MQHVQQMPQPQPVVPQPVVPQPVMPQPAGASQHSVPEQAAIPQQPQLSLQQGEQPTVVIPAASASASQEAQIQDAAEAETQQVQQQVQQAEQGTQPAGFEPPVS